MQAVKKRKKSQEKDRAKKNKGIKTEIKEGTVNKKTLGLVQRTEKSENITETVRRRITRSAATRSRRSIRKNIRKTDRNQENETT